MIKKPKRRKSKDNPYSISSIENFNIIQFRDNKKVLKIIEVNSEIYEMFNKFELEDISQLHEYERHIEHSLIYEETLYKRKVSYQPTVEEIIIKKIIYENLYCSIKSLSEIQRRRIIMYYFKNMTLDKIAQLEHCSIHSVFVSIERGKENLKKILFNSSEVTYNYDVLGRIINSNINNLYDINYEYVTNGYRTTKLVKSIRNNNDKFSYKYDKLDNITHVYHNDCLENRYYYNEHNELIKEDDYLAEKTIKYKYDNLGNLLSKKIYEINSSNQLSEDKYVYNNNEWPDQLTAFNKDVITYDEIGNPLTIGSNITLSWINGRQLHSYNDNLITVNYKYNIDDYRISKIVNNIETKYYWEGSKIILEKTGNDVLYYLYSTVNNLIGFIYNNDKYYYLKNKQDDILGIMNSNGSIVAKYSYDSWGNIIAITDGNNIDISSDDLHIANVNPFRYRSYYYDKETGLYYLNSRYYNPVWGRFINTDCALGMRQDMISYNLYAYCSNNPINYIDEDGNFWKYISKKWNQFTKKANKVICQTASYINKTINSIISINAKKEVKTHLSTKAGISGKAYVDAKTTSYVKSSTSSTKSLIGIDYNSGNGNFWDVTLSVSINSPFFQVSYESGLTSTKLSAGIVRDKNYTGIEAGMNGLEMFVGGSSDTELEDGIGVSSYAHANVHSMISAMVYAYAKIGVPAIVTDFCRSGSWVFEQFA